MSGLAGALPLALVLLTLCGGVAVRFLSTPERARRAGTVVVTLSVLLAGVLAARAGRDPEVLAVGSFGILGVDALSRLLVPLVALLGWALVLAAPRRWAEPRALSRLLINLSLVMAAFLVRDTRAFAALWVATLVPTSLELRRAPGSRAAARVFAIYAGASAIALVVGLLLLGMPLVGRADLWDVRSWYAGGRTEARVVGLGLVLLAVFIRKATLPFHSWLPTVFAVAPPGPVLLLVAPMVGAYALVRCAIPLFPELLGERLFLLGPPALLTAAYAAGLAFVQTELRRTVAWIAISQSAIVLVGLECPEGAGLTGGLVAWLSAAAAMTGLGLSAWMLEARFGPLDVRRSLGLYRRSPALALVFLLCGLSLVGFPGTVGFVSDDLLLSAVLEAFPLSGLLLFFATAVSGFTVLRTYLRLFHGPPAGGADLRLLPREWLALLLPLALVIGQGLYPAPLVRLGAEASSLLLGRAASIDGRPAHEGDLQRAREDSSRRTRVATRHSSSD